MYRGVARVDRPLFGRNTIPGPSQYSYIDGKLSLRVSAPRSTSANKMSLFSGTFCASSMRSQYGIPILFSSSPRPRPSVSRRPAAT